MTTLNGCETYSKTTDPLHAINRWTSKFVTTKDPHSNYNTLQQWISQSLSLFLATHFNILGVLKKYVCQEVFVKAIKIYQDIDGVGEDYWFIARLIFWPLSILRFQSNDFSPLFYFVLFCLISSIRKTSAAPWISSVINTGLGDHSFKRRTHFTMQVCKIRWIWKLFLL